MRMILVATLSALAGAAIMFALFQYGARLMPAMDQRQGLPTGSTKDFADGIGIYYLNEGKYNLLIWKKKLFAPGAAPEEKDIAEAVRSAIPVKKGVRFFSFGLDISKLPVVPPYAMAFCIIPDVRTVEGVFPIRIKLIERTEPIYELLPPPLIDTLSPGNVLWAINYQYSCNDGWVFKFQ
jgi:hypothetical protein